jgi:hypothetical protein
MIDPTHFDFCVEYAFVEKSIEVCVSVQGDTQRFRLDALHRPDSPTPHTVNAYIQKEISTPTEEEPDATSYAWVVHHLPSILTARSADEALIQALSSLPRGGRGRK